MDKGTESSYQALKFSVRWETGCKDSIGLLHCLDDLQLNYRLFDSKKWSSIHTHHHFALFFPSLPGPWILRMWALSATLEKNFLRQPSSGQSTFFLSVYCTGNSFLTWWRYPFFSEISSFLQLGQRESCWHSARLFFNFSACRSKDASCASSCSTLCRLSSSVETRSAGSTGARELRG